MKEFELTSLSKRFWLISKFVPLENQVVAGPYQVAVLISNRPQTRPNAVNRSYGYALRRGQVISRHTLYPYFDKQAYDRAPLSVPVAFSSQELYSCANGGCDESQEGYNSMMLTSMIRVVYSLRSLIKASNPAPLRETSCLNMNLNSCCK